MLYLISCILCDVRRFLYAQIVIRGMQMALIKKPVNGMKDILPDEMQIRDYVISVIKKTYSGFGFESIETPCVENIENLTSKQGGDNEKLIFRILKRGEKLKIEEAKTADDLADGGLRYDLTVPLVRYFSAHENELRSPFKALQMGNVWRADRPQKGRYRQFMQCDIDIIGEPTNLAEIELILATTTTLGKLGFDGFQIRINDRRILKAMALHCGFNEEDLDQVFITLDKMDKIGIEGVRSELVENGASEGSADAYTSVLDRVIGTVKEEGSIRGIEVLKEELGDDISEDIIEWMNTIIDTVDAAKQADFTLVFDPTIVRGMSYYTGTIFEIAMPQLGISCGGGGRYDGMVGKFTGRDVPACGFSIGFERIILIMMENGFSVPGAPEKHCYLIEKNMPDDKLKEIFAKAAEKRAEGETVLVAHMNKNKKFQKQQLAEQGYTVFEEFYR